MKRSYLLLVSILLWAFIAVAQEPTVPPPDAPPAPELKPRPAPATDAGEIPMERLLDVGTEIRASLDAAISSKTSQAGDEFTATLMEPLRNKDGQVLVPTGARIRGRIAGIERGKLFGSMRNARARLNLRFTDLMLEGGDLLPIEASLTGINESSTRANASTSEVGDVNAKGAGGRETVRDIGVGAGGGTLAGLIFGSALKGALIGAIAGGGYVLATQGRNIELPPNTGLRVRLDRYVIIPAGSPRLSEAPATPPAPVEH